MPPLKRQIAVAYDWSAHNRKRTAEPFIGHESERAPKRARTRPPPGPAPNLMIDIWETRPLHDAKCAREMYDVDFFGTFKEPLEREAMLKDAAARDAQAHRVLPPPAPDGADVVHPRWALDSPGAESVWIRVRRARTALDGGRAHFVLFRLPRDVLVRNLHTVSLAFSPELAFEGGATRDGLPVLDVEVIGDTPEDWALMCTVLFEPEAFSKQERYHWDDIVRLLELARKHSCLPLRDAAVSILSMVFPTTRAGFGKRNGAMERRIFGRPMYYHGEALELAKKYELMELLPAVRFAVASEYTADELLIGFAPCEGADQAYPRAARPAPPLDDAELERLLRGQEHLAHMRRLQTLAPLVNVSRTQPEDEQCRHTNEGQSCAHVLAALSDAMLADAALWAPRHALSSLDGRTMRALRSWVCGSCAARLKKELYYAREMAWDKLPHVFGMGAWQEVTVRAKYHRETAFQWWLEQNAEVVAEERREKLEATMKLREGWAVSIQDQYGITAEEWAGMWGAIVADIHAQQQAGVEPGQAVPAPAQEEAGLEQEEADAEQGEATVEQEEGDSEEDQGDSEQDELDPDQGDAA